MKKPRIFENTPRSLLIFYVLVLYVVIQSCWWYYLLLDLNNQIFDLRSSLAGLLEYDVGLESSLRKKLQQKQWMVFGEGMVFLLLLLLGFIQTRKSFKRETQVARQQKNFLLSVTHELKSPIASVKLYLQTLEKRELDRSKQIDLLQKAITETNRLDHLVENMLVAAQIENQALLIQAEELNLSEFVHAFISEFEEKNQIKISGKRVSGVMIQADPLSMRSILVNLAENALKYSGANPEIAINLSVEDNQVVMQVCDQGIGIAEEDRHRVFDKFYRSGNEETRQTKGTGLGLFIVRYLVGLQSGSISVHNNTPKGSTFELRFKSI
jgi:signal transduction histidine kinase